MAWAVTQGWTCRNAPERRKLGGGKAKGREFRRVAKLPWFKFRSSEYDVMTRGWTAEQHGVVTMVLLLMAQDARPGYVTAKGKPAPRPLIAQRIGVSVELLDSCLNVAFDVGVLEAEIDGSIRSPWIVADSIAYHKQVAGAVRGGQGRAEGRAQGRAEGRAQPYYSNSNSPSDSSVIQALEKGIGESARGDCADDESGPLAKALNDFFGWGHVPPKSAATAREVAIDYGLGNVVDAMRAAKAAGMKFGVAMSAARKKGFRDGDKLAKESGDDGLADAVKGVFG